MSWEDWQEALDSLTDKETRMSDGEIIEQVAKLWVELGGDSEGLVWCYRELRDAVDRLCNSEGDADE